MTIQGTGQQALQSAQIRLAKHYVNKLRQANGAVKRGQQKHSYWVSLIDQDWMQIQKWQKWAAAGSSDDLERAQLCTHLSLAANELLRVRQSPPERLLWLEQALAAAQRVGDGEAERLCLFQLGQTLFYMGRADEAERYGRTLLDLARQADDQPNLGHAWYTLGSVALHRGTLAEAEEAFKQCLAVFEPLGDQIEMGRAYQGLGRALMFRGDSRAAHPYFERYLHVVETHGNEAELSTAYITLNNVLINLNDFQPAKIYAERAVEVCRRTGFQRILPTALLCLGVCEAELGDLDAAAEHYEEALDLGRSINAMGGIIDILRYLADARARQGRLDEAFAHLQEALALSREGRILYYLVEVCAALAWWYAERDELSEARATLREGIDYAFEIGSDNFLARVLLSAAQVWLHAGEAESAARWLGLLSGYAEHLETRRVEPLKAAATGSLGAQRFQELYEAGKTLLLEDALKGIAQAVA
ncbi:MAG: tetratricopeptide repeat protein [Chloroflexi bacterium]|nr:tetratricopeptide repeat protein [Chloroflexota bacterium]